MTSLLFALGLLAAAAPSAGSRRPLPAPAPLAAAPAAAPAPHDSIFPPSATPPLPEAPAAPVGRVLETGAVEEPLLAPQSAPGLGSALPALVVIASLGGLALYLARRRPGTGQRLVQVLETASLGPRRQLVVVRLGDSLMLLGSSESGVTLLSMQPGAAPAPAADAGTATPSPVPLEPKRPSLLSGLWSRLRDRAPAAPGPSFEELLLESADDQALRRKLASGRSARVA